MADALAVIYASGTTKPLQEAYPMFRALYERGRVTGLLLLAVTVTLLTMLLLAPPARLIDIGAPGDAYLASNFYQPEQAGSLSFRWSSHHSSLFIPDITTQGVILTLRLHGSAVGQDVYLKAADALAPFAVISAGPDWQIYQVLLLPALADEMTTSGQVVQLVTTLTQPGPTDPRELGVAIDWVSLQPVPTWGALPQALGYAGMLGWAIALVGGVIWLGIRVWEPAAPRRKQLEFTFFLLTVLAVCLLAWARLDPYSLHWLLPLHPAYLALATLILVMVRWRLGAPPLQAGRGEVVAAATLIGMAHLLIWAPLPAAWRGVAALIILWAPGWLLACWITLGEPSRAARLLLGICGALGLQIILLLIGAMLPLGLNPWGLLLMCDLLSLLGIALLWQAPPPPASQTGTRLSLMLGLVLILACGMRLPFLGNAELHDDEASVLIAAAQLVQGDGNVLLTQLKGPAQVLLPAGPLALTGQLPELAARLPFALAGLGVVLGGFALARALAGGNEAAGLLTALILALDGFMIAFSRIVQYQSVVILLLMGALWCAWRFAEGGEHPRRLLTGAALLLALALLGHYDAIFAAPALLWLVLVGGRRRGWRPGEWAATLAWPILGAGTLLASFYVPFMLHPHFAEVVGHLSERTGQSRTGWASYNNLASTYGLLTFYNHAGAILLLGLLLLGGLANSLFRVARTPWLGRLSLCLLAIAGLDLLRGPGESLLLSPSPVALALWALPLVALILAPGTPAGLRTLLIWFGAGGVATLFLIAQPRTHVYVAAVPAALLAGWCGAALLAALSRPRARPLRLAVASLTLLVTLLALLHQATLYVRQSPEYQRAYPATRLVPLTWGGTTNLIDRDARFGFPSQDGWKAVGELYRRGELRGPYASNQSSEVLFWYTRGLRRCGATPEIYMIALSRANAAIPQGYYHTRTIQVDGQDQIAIFEQTPPVGQPQIVPLEHYRTVFDEQPVPRLPNQLEAC